MLAYLPPLFFFAVLMGSPVPGFLVFMLLGSWHAWQSWRHPQTANAFHWTREDTWLALCFMSIPLFKLLSLLWSPDPALAQGNVAWHLYFLFWPLMLMALARCQANPVHTDRALATGLIVSALLAVYLSLLGSNTSINSMGNVGILAQLAMAVGAWNLLALTRQQSADSSARGLYGLAFLATWVVLVLSTRRLELLGFAALSFGILVYRLWRHLNARRLMGLVAIALLALCILVWLRWEKFALGFSEVAYYFDSRANGGPFVNSSWGARLEMWRLGWMGFLEHPLLGHSASGRPFNMTGAPPMDTFGHRLFHSHLMQTLVEGGLLGLMVLVAALWHSTRVLIIRPWATQRETALLAAGLLAAYALEGAASAALVYDKPNALLVVMSAWIWLRLRQRAD